MAILPDNTETGRPWQITNIGNDVVIIECPGTDDEKVHVRYDATNQQAMSDAMITVRNVPYLDEEQRFLAAFWMGYFYVHLF